MKYKYNIYIINSIKLFTTKDPFPSIVVIKIKLNNSRLIIKLLELFYCKIFFLLGKRHFYTLFTKVNK
jgi:hypothetical protein